MMVTVFILMTHLREFTPYSRTYMDQSIAVFDTQEHCEKWRDVAQRVIPQESGVEKTTDCVQFEVKKDWP